jgi:chromosome partitioning protein
VVDPENLVGISEIAELAKVSRQLVNNWRVRYEGFPRPVRTLQSGPVWDREAVGAWLKTFKGEPTHVLSFINLKGGVGKTTVAVAVAELLAQEERKRVLVIDLDPQTNASVTLISEERWAEMDKAGQTVAQLFADRLNPGDSSKFDVDRSIARGVSTINDGIARLDLLPSSIRLIEVQDRIPLIGTLDDSGINPREILKIAIQPVVDSYDYVIIDCPPSLGIVTKNGLRISNGYIIPTIPDILSTWGIYQIVTNVQRFSDAIRLPIPPLGIVATKVQRNNLHDRVMADLQAGRLGRFAEEGAIGQPPLFTNYIKQTVAVARGADVESDIRTFKGKYGEAYPAFSGLAKEIKALCETKKP